jgi:hypothetical protein
MRLRRNRIPLLPGTDDDQTLPGPSNAMNRAPATHANEGVPHANPHIEGPNGDAKVSTIESLNILPGDVQPPITFTDEHGNVTAYNMQDLTLSVNPVNFDTNEEPLAGTVAQFSMRTSNEGGTTHYNT